ncbi:MAG: VWA domain-containing protein [Pyrinomonadaceae bacterium]|nr:VWA domain-containing protein [Pyrinomonadaceae bacterium]
MSKNKPLTIIAVLFLTLAQAVTCFPQQTPAASSAKQDTSQQDDTIRVGTAVVQTEAIVTDKNGKRINGLTASDFQVMDDGAPQTIDFFTVIEGSRVLNAPAAAGSGGAGNAASGAGAEAPASPLTNPYQGRHIALVFDDLNISLDNFNRSRKALADFINTKLTPNDMVALIATGGALASLQQFTNDKQRLLSALNRIAAQNRIKEQVPRLWNITDDEALRIDRGDTTALQNVTRRAVIEDSGPQNTMANESSEGLGRGNLSASMESKVRTIASSIVRENAMITRNNLATLKGLFRGMADLPGRKIAVLMTETFVTADGTTEDTNNELTQITELARRSGISVYALDVAGLRTNSVGAAEQISASTLASRNINPDMTLSSFERLNGARKLVAGTGGALIENTNSLIAGLDRAIEESSNYYVLGFKPAVLDNKFHRLSVKIKGKPELIVRARRGYLAANPETIRGTGAELKEALSSPVPVIGLPLELVANVVPTGNEQVTITGLHVGRNYLTLPAPTAADQTAAYDIETYVFSAGRDDAVGGVKRTVTYDLANPEQRQKLKKEGAVLLVKEYTQLPPGIYQVRAVVREKATGLVGSAYQFFEVPDTKDRKTVSMSSIVLTPAGQPAFSGANSFKLGSDVDVRFVIYNLPKDVAGLTQRVKLVSAIGDKPQFDMELPILQPTGPDRAQAAQVMNFTLPTDYKLRGRYSVIVTLKDAKGKVDVERRTDFVIE